MKKYLCFMLIALIALASFVSCEAEPEHVHDMKKVEAKPATCTEDGYEAYEECECGYKTEIVVIPAGHELEDVAGLASTCTVPGYTAYKDCANCDYIEGKNTLELADHELEDVAGLESTCTEAGYTAHKACENCDYTEGKEVVPAAGHTIVDCANGGSHKECSVCDYVDNTYTAKQSDWTISEGKTTLTPSCGCEFDNIAAAIGSIGPAGGYIFYDCDADNTAEDPDGADNKASETCGWRYLEASKILLGKDSGGNYTIDAPSTKNVKVIFGYYSEDGESISRIGITESGKNQGLGLGKSYTKTLCDNKDKLYKDAELTGLATNLACVAVDSISITVNSVVFDDWYVPSTGEMVIYANSGLKAPFSSTQTLMTSTEAAGDDTFIEKFKGVEFTIGENKKITGQKVSSRGRGEEMRVIPIRQF